MPRFYTLSLLLALAIGLHQPAAHAQTAPAPTPPDTPLSPPPASAARVETAQLEASTLQAASALHALDEEAGGTSAAASTNGSGPIGIIPATRGFNMSLGTTSQHDSAGGWSSLLTPNVAFRFNRFFSANVGVPVYSYVNVYGISIKSTHPELIADTYGFKTRNFILGDTTLAGQFEAHPAFFDYNVTATLALPTGDDANGFGAGQPTFNFNNHFERPIASLFTPDIEIGIGDSPNLVNSRVKKSYVDVGTNAHFQAGVNFQLPFNLSFSTDAYEELPLSTQTITSTTTNGKKGKQLKIVTTTSERSIGEDNGFLNTLDIPINAHVTLSGFYNRSLRNKIDTAGFSFTFLLRAPPRGKDTIH